MLDSILLLIDFASEIERNNFPNNKPLDIFEHNFMWLIFCELFMNHKFMQWMFVDLLLGPQQQQKQTYN